MDSKLNFAIPIKIRKISIGQLRRIKRGKGERKIVVVTDYAIIRVLSWWNRESDQEANDKNYGVTEYPNKQDHRRKFEADWKSS